MVSPSHTVPSEVAQRVVRSVTDRQTLTVLARTTRTLQNAAEKRMYECIEFFHYPIFFSLCETLATHPRVAALVRTFILTAGPPHRSRDREREQQIQYQVRQMVDNPEYWTVIHKILGNLQSLEYLYIADPTFENSWILAPLENWSLRAVDVRLYLPWDENVAAFLETQDRLRLLTVSDVAENVPVAPLSNTALLNLTHFEGPLMLVDQLLHCPITHLKFPVDTEDALSLLPLVLPELSRFKKLKSLSIATIPLEMLLPSTATLSIACPRLKYLSHVPLPMEHKTRLKLLQYLSRFAELSVLELDIAHWNPQPVGAAQRIFAVELRMVLPNLKYVFFWNRHDRWIWMWSPEEVEPLRGFVFEDSEAAAAAPAAGTATAAADAMSSAEDDFVGLEGWKRSWNQTHYANQSTTWRSIL